MRDQVETDLVSKCGRLDRLAVQHLTGLFFQFSHTLGAGTAGSLIGGGNQTDQFLCPMERSHSHQHNDGGAVGVGDHALVKFGIFRVDFRNDQRHIIFHAECAGVINHQSTGIHHCLAIFLGNIRTGTEQSKIHTLEGFGRHFLNCNISAAKFSSLTGRTLGSQKLQIANRKITLFQRLDHFYTDCTGSTRHRNIEPLRHCFWAFL